LPSSYSLRWTPAPLPLRDRSRRARDFRILNDILKNCTSAMTTKRHSLPFRVAHGERVDQLFNELNVVKLLAACSAAAACCCCVLKG
jgi:hypothetical protein